MTAFLYQHDEENTNIGDWLSTPPPLLNNHSCLYKSVCAFHSIIIKRTLAQIMGSPDYPGDENHTFQPPPGHAMPMHGQLHSDEDAADSDNNDLPPPPAEYIQPLDPYQSAGYQPLNADEMAADDSTSSDDDDDSDAEHEENNRIQPDETVAAEPPETTVEREVIQEVWNAPRPAELDIELDKNKTDQVRL